MTREEYAKRYGVDAPPSPTAQIPASQSSPEGIGGVRGFGKGIAKGLAGTTLGLGGLAGKAATGIGKLIPGEDPFERFGGKVEKGFQALQPLAEARGKAEKAGKFVEEVAEFAVPGTKVAKLTKSAGLLPKIAKRAAVSGAVGAAQAGEVGERAGIAAGTEAAFPVAGKVIAPAARLVGRLLKGIGTGLSGMSANQLKAILDNPKSARQFVKQIKDAGGTTLLRKEAETIVRGISQIRRDARRAFGRGLEELSEAEIPKKQLRESLKGAIKKFGISTKGGRLTLKNVEFDSPKNIQKAKDLLNKVNTQKDLSGTGLRKLINDIDNSAFKTTGGDAERLSFNAFTRELSDSITDSISATTPKLKEIKTAFSQEMQLAESVEKIFGKVKFGNAKEILTVSQKLESLFSQKGLAPEVVDSFFSRIGESVAGLRTGEAVRQVTTAAERANTIGTNPFEIFRSITAAIVPPSAVRDIAIVAGITEQIVKEMVDKLAPATRGILIRTIIGDDSQNIDNQ